MADEYDEIVDQIFTNMIKAEEITPEARLLAAIMDQGDTPSGSPDLIKTEDMERNTVYLASNRTGGTYIDNDGKAFDMHWHAEENLNPEYTGPAVHVIVGKESYLIHPGALLALMDKLDDDYGEVFGEEGE